MTATLTRSYTILDHEFEADELIDIVNHSMSDGSHAFKSSRACLHKSNEFDDEIEEFLSDWYFDTMGERDYIGAISKGTDNPVGSVDELKNRMVWSYVELKADEILAHNGYEY